MFSSPRASRGALPGPGAAGARDSNRTRRKLRTNSNSRLWSNEPPPREAEHGAAARPRTLPGRPLRHGTGATEAQSTHVLRAACPRRRDGSQRERAPPSAHPAAPRHAGGEGGRGAQGSGPERPHTWPRPHPGGTSRLDRALPAPLKRSAQHHTPGGAREQDEGFRLRADQRLPTRPRGRQAGPPAVCGFAPRSCPTKRETQRLHGKCPWSAVLPPTTKTPYRCSRLRPRTGATGPLPRRVPSAWKRVARPWKCALKAATPQARNERPQPLSEASKDSPSK